MAVNDERVVLKMMMTPELDARATQKTIRDATDLHRQLSKMKLDFRDLAKYSNTNIGQIRDLAKAADVFSKRLTQGARDATSSIRNLERELSQATKEADALKKLHRATKSKSQKDDISKSIAIQSQRINSLNKELGIAKTNFSKYGSEIKKVLKSQQGYHRHLEKLGKFTGKDVKQGLVKGVQQMFAKGGGTQGIGTIFKSLGKGAGGAAARKNLGSAAGGGAGGAGALLNMRTLSLAVSGVAAMAGSVGALVALLKMASDHQAKLNKEMVKGLGTARDFAGSTEAYSRAISDVRNGAIDAAKSLLEFGIRSEDSLKTINAFAQQSTGSLVKTRNELLRLGDGDMQKGISNFSKSAVAYGKALGIEMTEVGSMMGSFVGEIGYGTQNVQGLMGEIVSAASTSALPVGKFMDIFRQTIPHLELFTNRMEELTGTIKLLSKSMSPGQVKEFMNAWGKSLKFDSFQSRLKKTLIAGVGTTNRLLGEGFSERAGVMAAQLGGELGAEFQQAFKSGDMTGALGVITKAKSRGVGDPALFGQMTQMVRAEQSRRKGGALGTASAMKGASMMEQLKLAQAQRTRLTGRTGDITGIDEHVMEKIGYDQQQIEALNNFQTAVRENRTSLRTYGATTSKSMNEALTKIIAAQKYGGDTSMVTREDMAKVTDDQVMAATELSVKNTKIALTAQDYAAQQVQETTSISEKLDNVIAFWLEKVFQVLSPIIDVLNNIYEWISGGKDERKQIKQVNQWQAGVARSGESPAMKNQMSLVTDSLVRSISSGKTGAELGSGVGEQMGYLKDTFKNADMSAITQYIRDRARATGSTGTDASVMAKEIREALQAGDMGKAFGKLAEMGSDDATEMQEFAKVLASKYGVSDSATQMATDAARTRRAGSVEKKRLDTAKEYEEKTAGDVFDAEGLGKLGTPAAATAAEAYDFSPQIIEAQSQATDDLKSDLDKQTKEAKDQNKNLSKLDRKMATGVAMDATPKTQKVINTATLEAFRMALMEYAVHEMRIGQGGDYATQFGNMDWGLLNEGATLGDLGKLDKGDGEGVKRLGGMKHDGGPITSNGMYRLLKGEHVLSAGQSASLSSGGGGRPVQAVINLHGTNLSEAEAQRMVENAMHNVMNRH